jgi:hypothetical protein
VKDYGATPEDVNADDDHGVAIQKAIDDAATPGSPNCGKVVLIPRGHFHVAKPLIVRKALRLIGAAKTISVIQAKHEWKNSLGAVVETAEDASGNNILSDLAILGYPRMTLLHVRSGGFFIRDVLTEILQQDQYKMMNPPEVPYILFSGNAGGSLYNLSTGQIGKYGDTETGKRYPGYYLLMVSNTRQPISLYSISIEHFYCSPQMMIQDARNVVV